MDKRAITVGDFAEAYAIPIATARKMIRQGRILALNIGTERHPIYRIPIAELDRFEQASFERNTAPATSPRSRRQAAAQHRPRRQRS